MAAKQFLGTRYQSFKDDGTVNASGWVYFYEPGTSTEKTTYSDSDLGTANASPVVLNAAGAADIWYEGDADVSVYDSAGTLIDSYSSINPAISTSVQSASMILNGSFEEGGSTTPSSWTRSAPPAGASSAQDSDSAHGDYAWKFTSAGAGAGYLISEDFFNVAEGRPFTVTWSMKSSVADVRNLVEVVWYDDADAEISASSLYDDSTTNPTTYTAKSAVATPVSTAVKAKLRFTGCHSSDATAGSTWFDGVDVLEAPRAIADNTFSGSNTFSGTNTFTPAQIFTAGVGPNYVQNIGLTASVAAKALTIALKTKALADASSTDPIGIAFRNATLTTGDYTIVNAVAATSIVVPSGATLGFLAAEAATFYVYVINNAGTIELAVSRTLLLDEGGVISTTAIGTGSDSNTTFYSTSARTNVAVRLIGGIAITTGAVAGEWDNEDTAIYVGDSLHYNTGLWTPSVGGDATYTTQTGTWTRRGNLVHLEMTLTINVIGTGSTNSITGIPFPAATTHTKQSCYIGAWSGLAVSLVNVFGYITNSTLTLTGITAAGTTSSGGAALIGSATSISLSCDYEI